MSIKEEKGLTGVDIAISLIIMTMFIAMIANLIAKTNLISQNAQKKSIATSYAIQEIEKIKAQGYVETYDSKGITSEETLKEEDIYNNSEFTGYHKETSIKDYVYIINDNTKQKDIVKEITVEISYKLGKEEKSIKISTYIAKETNNER